MNDLSVNTPAAEVDLIDLSAGIVSAYVSHNALSVTDLPKLIGEVHSALRSLLGGGVPEPAEELRPAVPVKKSITPDYLVCLEDGKKFKSLKRHLRTHYDLSPEQYREKWGLPADYPMVAPSYSATRSRLAKDNGLGRKDAAPARGR
jgi:predicted transcriptional regulator